MSKKVQWGRTKELMDKFSGMSGRIRNAFISLNISDLSRVKVLDTVLRSYDRLKLAQGDLMIALARDGLSAKESKLLRSFDIKFQDDLSGYRDFISQLLMNSMDVAPKGEVEINQ